MALLDMPKFRATKKPESKTSKYLKNLAQRKRVRDAAKLECLKILDENKSTKEMMLRMIQTGCCYKEIAEMLGVTYEYVKSSASLFGMTEDRRKVLLLK